jgi:hypothetical protein
VAGTPVEDLFALLGVKVDKSAFEKARAALAGLAAQTEGASKRAQSRWSKALGVIGNGASKGFKAVGKAVAGASVAVAAGAAVFGKLGLNAIESASELVAASNNFGVSTTNLQRLTKAAEVSGSGFDDLKLSFGALANNLEAAKAKIGENGELNAQQKALKALGISLKDPAIVAGDLNAVLLKVADGLKGVENPQKRLALAQDLIGKAGNKMVGFLGQGADAILAVGDAAEKSNKIVGEEQLQSLNSAGDGITKLKGNIKSLILQAFARMAPTIEKLVKQMDAWITANGAWLGQKIEQGINVLTQVLELLGTALTLVKDNSLVAGLAIASIAAVALGPLGLVLTAITTIIAGIEKINAFRADDKNTDQAEARANAQNELSDARLAFGQGKISKSELDKARAKYQGVTARQRSGDFKTDSQINQTIAELQQTAPAVFGRGTQPGNTSNATNNNIQTTINVQTAATDPKATARAVSERQAREIVATLSLGLVRA